MHFVVHVHNVHIWQMNTIWSVLIVRHTALVHLCRDCLFWLVAALPRSQIMTSLFENFFRCGCQKFKLGCFCMVPLSSIIPDRPWTEEYPLIRVSLRGLLYLPSWDKIVERWKGKWRSHVDQQIIVSHCGSSWAMISKDEPFKTVMTLAAHIFMANL